MPRPKGRAQEVTARQSNVIIQQNALLAIPKPSSDPNLSISLLQFRPTLLGATSSNTRPDPVLERSDASESRPKHAPCASRLMGQTHKSDARFQRRPQCCCNQLRLSHSLKKECAPVSASHVLALLCCRVRRGLGARATQSAHKRARLQTCKWYLAHTRCPDAPCHLFRSRSTLSPPSTSSFHSQFPCTPSQC